MLGEIGDCLSRSIRDSQADETGFCQAKAYLASDLGANERCREVTASASSERKVACEGRRALQKKGRVMALLTNHSRAV